MRVDARAIAVLAALGCTAWPRPARAFCRTTTCELTPGFSPTPQTCYPPADEFAADCYCTRASDFESCLTAFAEMPVKPVVTAYTLWWRNHCVGYDLNENASAQVPYDRAVAIVAESFSKWTGVECSTPRGPARVSADVRDLGPVACDAVKYNSAQGNQNAIIFHDDVWPHNDSTNTLGLTTVTFDFTTGEIYDADMEINATLPLSTGTPTGSEYDLQSIITHEAGHFLGLAHTPDAAATMYALYSAGSTNKRILTVDDTAGICSIYRPDGSRAVETWTSADGGAWSSSPSIPEGACDPTPRHGFQSACSSPQKGAGCSLVGGSAGVREPGALRIGTGASALALVLASRRRRRVRGRRSVGAGA
jgi:hypothetical protein